MSITIDDLLRSSFRCIGQLLPGFGHSTSERTDALFVLNAMLDGMAAEGLDDYATLTNTYTLVPGQQSYTIGSGGNFNAARPVRITKATLVVLSNPASPLRLDLDLLNSDQWGSIKLQSTPSPLPRKLYYATTWPLATVNLWPVPTEANQVELSSGVPLAGNFTSGSTVFSAPPGYLDAIRYNLAVRLAMEWDKPLKPGIAELASESLAKIQRLNAPTPQMDVNPGVMPVSGGRSGWNRLTGDWD